MHAGKKYYTERNERSRTVLYLPNEWTNQSVELASWWHVTRFICIVLLNYTSGQWSAAGRAAVGENYTVKKERCLSFFFKAIPRRPADRDWFSHAFFTAAAKDRTVTVQWVPPGTGSMLFLMMRVMSSKEYSSTLAMYFLKTLNVFQL